MRVGVPLEVKGNEYRVALTPAGAEAITKAGHNVLVQAGAGDASGFTDDYYERAGAEIAAGAHEVWSRSDIVTKVKEPVESEWPSMRPGQVIFGYFHFAASAELTRAVMDSGAVAIAYETVGPRHGDLPLLTPMSEVAGRMSVQEGARYLGSPAGGSGTLLGGVPGVLPAKVLVLGGGVVGTQAALMAAGLGARVSVMDTSLARLRKLAHLMPANVNVLYSTRYAVRKQLRDSDLVIGAVLVPGNRAPRLVERADLATMRRGSVIVDVAVDQGGCVETIRPTTHAQPVYVVDGVIHYGVTNIPGAVPRTSTLALTNATLPYLLAIVSSGWKLACQDDPELARGVNIVDGQITHPGVSDAFEGTFERTGDAAQHGWSGAQARSQVRVRFRRLATNPDLPLPARATADAAGFDVRSSESFRLEPGAVRFAPTGLVMEMPSGVECQVRPRSGLAARYGVTMPNSPGTIDADYRGELRVLLQNLGPDPVSIVRGDRVAQLVFNRPLVPWFEEASELSATGRGSEGFGSTGVK